MSSRVARSWVMSSPAPTVGDRIPATDWSIIIPVKQTTLGKSRLTGRSDEERRELALAFALDTVVAAVSAPGVRRVVVVTNDPDAKRFGQVGAEVLADVPDAGINAAIVHGAHHLAAADHDEPTGLVALTGDLPALTPQTLATALSSTTAPRWFVPDQAGTGTTTLAAVRTRLSPSFGPHSRASHRSSGASELDVPGLERLRRDVDTEVDLWDAVRLGVGVHTREVLSSRAVRPSA
jgi:2-phospho-L-lactate/phosphoenolpyruvate guanylyltransferase